MRRSLLRIILVAVPICGATVAFAKLAGPPRGVTGAWAVGSRTAEPNCLYCHNPDHPLNDPGGKLEILDVPAQFQPDTDYPLRVRLSHVWDPLPPSPHWGFELTAVRADSGTGYGTFVTGAGTRLSTQSRPGEDPTRNYISHNLAGLHIGDPGPVEWSFVWHSPAYFAAKVYFFAAGNSANGDSTNSHDYIFTTADSSEAASVAVPDLLPSHTTFYRPQPNPAPGYTDLRYSLARSGIVDLAIFDIAGRRVRSLVHGYRPAGSATVRWDGRSDAGARAANGLYFARFGATGAGLPRVWKFTLSR